MSLRAQIIAVLRTLGEPATTAEIAKLCDGGTSSVEVTSEVARMVRDKHLVRHHNPKGFLKYGLRSMAPPTAPNEVAATPATEAAAPPERAEAPQAQESPGQGFNLVEDLLLGPLFGSKKDAPSAPATSPPTPAQGATRPTPNVYGEKSAKVLEILRAASGPIKLLTIVEASNGALTKVDVSGRLKVLSRTGKVKSIGDTNRGTFWFLADRDFAIAHAAAAQTPAMPAASEFLTACARDAGSPADKVCRALESNYTTALEALDTYLVESRVDLTIYKALIRSRNKARIALNRHAQLLGGGA